jgi:hypothetical protein
MVMASGWRQPAGRALTYGVPLGVLCSLPFVLVWIKNAPHFFRLPPRRSISGRGDLPFFTSLFAWSVPELRQTGIVFLCTWNLMMAVDFVWFFGGTGHRGVPEVGPITASVASFEVMWALGYVISWWRLPAG